MPDTYSSSTLNPGAQRMETVAAMKSRSGDSSRSIGWRRSMRKAVDEASLVDVGMIA